MAELGQKELLAEYRALQELALASYNSQPGDAPTDDTQFGDQKDKSKINNEMEEYLLEQVYFGIMFCMFREIHYA